MKLFKKKKTKQTEVQASKRADIICENLNFAGSEAYKQLRTNVEFTIPSKGECRIVAVTSAQPGDGKSTTSINLSYSLAGLGLNVLLIEGDMRLPHMAERLNVRKEPGLSGLLSGQYKAKEVIQKIDKEAPFYALSAGSIPPNPSELLVSDEMEKRLEEFKKIFDYIIIDLPPINVVTDAVSLSKLVDGYILVVRQDKTMMRSVDAAIDKLRIVDAKILGFVLNAVKDNERGYGYNKEYGNYYKQTHSKSEHLFDSIG